MMSARSKMPEPSSRRYVEIETIRDEDGLIAIITERVTDAPRRVGDLSFKLLKEFESNGEIKASAYLGRRHIPAIERLVRRVEDRIDVLTDRARREVV